MAASWTAKGRRAAMLTDVGGPMPAYT